MLLHTNHRPWTDPEPLAASPLLAPATCDVLIIGAGVSAALIARRLVEGGLDVIAVDRRTAAGGSTSASTALIQADLDATLIDLAKERGHAVAVDVYRHARSALDQFRQLVRSPFAGEGAIDCDYAERPSLYLTASADDAARLADEAAARRAIGLDSEYLTAAQLRERFGVERAGGVLSPIACEVDPVRFTRELWRRIVARGARLFDRTAVGLSRSSAGEVLAHTQAGCPIHARHVVFAGGYESLEQFPDLRRRVRVSSTFALVTAPLSTDRPWADRALLWDAGDPYFYARTTPDHRLLAGGADEPTPLADISEEMVQSKARAILQQLRQAVPSLPPVTIDRAWAGTFVTTPDGLPLIGPIDGIERLHVALGAGGNGMLFAVIAAELIADAVAGRCHPLAHHYRPGVSFTPGLSSSVQFQRSNHGYATTV